MIKKKLLGILFVMALCLISFSVTASAESAEQTESSVVQVTVKGVTTYYDNFDDAFDKINSVKESSVKLLADCWRTYARETNRGFTQNTVIDLNGHTLSFFNREYGSPISTFEISCASVSFIDTSVGETRGRINAVTFFVTGARGAEHPERPELFGALTISDGIQVDSIDMSEHAMLTVEDAQINKIALQDHARCIISDGTVNSLSNSKHTSEADSAGESVFCAVSGGYIKKLDISYQEDITKKIWFPVYSLSGGTFDEINVTYPDGKDDRCGQFLTEGWGFYDSNDNLICASGNSIKQTVKVKAHNNCTHIVQNGESWCDLCGRKHYVATVNGKGCFDLHEVTEKAATEKNATIIMLSDIIYSYKGHTFTFDLGENTATLDLNGKNIKISDGTDYGNEIHIRSGTLNLKDSVGGGSISQLLNYATLNIYDFERSTIKLLWANQGTVDISSGEFGEVDYEMGNMNIRGGTFQRLSMNEQDGPLILHGGTFKVISTSHSPVNCCEILSDECAFQSTVTNKVIIGDEWSVADVKVVKHTHTPNTAGICECGRVSLSFFNMEVYGKEQVYSGKERQYSFSFRNPTTHTHYIPEFTTTGDTATDVGEYVCTVKGTGRCFGTIIQPWRIIPLELSDKNLSIATNNKVYDGTTNARASIADLTYTSDGKPATMLSKDYLVLSAAFADAEVGENKEINVKLRFSDNITYNGKKEADFTTSADIEKAMSTLPPNGILYVKSGVAHTYQYNLRELLPTLPEGCDYGKVSFGIKSENVQISDYYKSGTATIDKNGFLTVPIKEVAGSAIVTPVVFTISVTTQNYTDFPVDPTLRIITARNPLIGGPVLSRSTLTYGEKLSAIRLSGTMYDDMTELPVTGTFTWLSDTDKVLSAGPYDMEWSFSPDDTDNYDTAIGKIGVIVRKATPSGRPVYNNVSTDDKTLDDAAITTTNSSFSVPGTVKWINEISGDELPGDTPVTRGTAYMWEFTPDDTDNYNSARGSVVLWRLPVPAAPAPEVVPTTGGSTEISNPDPDEGDTVNVIPKPDDGKRIEKITVTDSSGNKLEIKRSADGSFSFTQPADEVTIEVTYGDIPTFKDVPETEWYNGAVSFVVERGVFNGMSPDTFEPNFGMTRGMFINALYNLAGNPTTASVHFDDVPDNMYYANAISWAATKGVANGVGDNKFMPDAPITREQMVTMLWNYDGKVAGGAGLEKFTDSAMVNDWALPAMKWAVENGIINGKSPTALDPLGTATRAEAATMFMNYLKK